MYPLEDLIDNGLRYHGKREDEVGHHQTCFALYTVAAAIKELTSKLSGQAPVTVSHDEPSDRVLFDWEEVHFLQDERCVLSIAHAHQGKIFNEKEAAERYLSFLKEFHPEETEHLKVRSCEALMRQRQERTIP